MNLLCLLLASLPAYTIAASVTFSCNSDSKWDDNRCWSTGSLPQKGDDVNIVHNSLSFTVTAEGIALDLNSITVGGAGGLQTLVFTSNSNVTVAKGITVSQYGKLIVSLTNSINGPGSLLATGDVVFQSGTIALPNVTVNKLTIEGPAAKWINTSQVTVNGAAAFTAGPLFLQEAAQIHVTSTGSFDFNTNSQLITPMPGCLLTVDGTITFTKEQALGLPLSVSGTMSVPVGTVELQNPNGALILIGQGAVTVAKKAILKLAGPKNSGDTDTSITGKGSLQLLGGLEMHGELSLPAATINGGAAELITMNNASLDSVTLTQAGKITNGAQLSISQLKWDFGGIGGMGTTIVQTMSMTSSNSKEIRDKAAVKVIKKATMTDSAMVNIMGGSLLIADISTWSVNGYSIIGQWKMTTQAGGLLFYAA